MGGRFEELDAKEEEKRKQDKIEYSKKKRTSNLFLVCITLFEIVETAILVILFLIISALLVYKVFHLTDNAGSLATSILFILSFIGAFILGVYIYRKVGRWAIKKWNLQEKLKPDVLNQFKTKEQLEEEQKYGRRS